MIWPTITACFPCLKFSQKDGLRLWQYWELSGALSQDSIEDASKKVHFLLKDASIRQIVADVPMGCLLSGGVDSSAIMHFVYEELQRRGEMPRETFRAFSLRLQDYSQSFEVSRKTADFCQI